MAKAAAASSIVLGVLALVQVLWFPTGALVFGVLALALGILAARWGDDLFLSRLGAALGGVAVVGTVFVVVATTSF
jgi:hypothetical protein